MNITIIGSGQALLDHVGIWQSIPNATIAGIIGVKEEKKQSLSESVQSKCVASLQALQLDAIDMLDICEPMDLALSLMDQIADQKVHVTCDMSLEKNPKEFRNMITTYENRGVQFYPRNTLRYASAYRNAQNLVEEGAIGKHGVIRLSIQKAHPDINADIFMALGTEPFDWILKTFGNATRITAKHIQKTSRQGHVVEYAVVTLKMESGAIIHVDLHWGGENENTSFELTGDKGMLSHNDRESKPIYLEQNVVPNHTNVLDQSSLRYQFEHLVHCFETNSLPLVSTNDVLAAMEIVTAGQKSVETGEPVFLNGGEK